MSAPIQEEELVPELGDLVTLISTVFGRLTGTIIYRNIDLIRVQSFSDADRAQDIPMGDDGDFHQETGIIKLIIHKKRDDPHFSLQLGVRPGETVNCYGIGGEQLETGGVVAEIIATDEDDAIVLQNGTKLNFAFVGPPEPIQVIFVTADPDTGDEVGHEAADAVKAVEAAPEQTTTKQQGLPDYYDLSLLEGLLPAAMVEEVPTAERTYSESVQREDMYMDLLKDYTESKQKNPKIQKKVARETELLLALKSVITTVGSDGRPKPYISPTSTLKDILGNTGSALASVIPVVSAKRVVYVDNENEESLPAEVRKQIELRLWLESELKSWSTEHSYTAGQDAGLAAKQSILMYKYLYTILNTDTPVLSSIEDDEPEIVVDQDVLRGVEPPGKLYGLTPLSSEKKATVTQDNIGKILMRQIRAISSHKTASGSIISPSDPGKISSYVLMPASMGFTWRPVKFSGFLAEDIRASNMTKQLPPLESQTNSKKAFADGKLKIISNDISSTDDVNVAEWVKANLQSNVHATDSLSVSSVGVNRVLDSIGLRSQEWDTELSEVIWDAVQKSQVAFTRAFAEFEKTVEEHIKGTKPYSIGAGIPEGSDIYTKAAKVKEIGLLLSQFSAEQPIHKDWDLAIASHLLPKAEGCLAQVLYFAINDEPHPLLEKAIQVYANEVNRKTLQNLALNNQLAKYSAEPTINTCPHCRDLDRIRSVMVYDENKFIKLLGEFLNRYQGDRKDNWVQCKVCSTHLLCIHEVMKFYEKTHAGRAPALSKEILLDFGGPAFNGRYICKNCGVPIAEFEYDNHLEYDDEGRPLAGRAPVEDGQKPPEEELSEILDVAMNKRVVTFDDPIKTQIYEIVSVLTLNAGFMFSLETITSLVNRIYVYETTKLPKEADYEAMRAASRKPLPAYDSFKANIEIAVASVLLLCELHTIDPLPELIYPFIGCPFARGGYPIETDDEAIQGTYEYLVCVIANMNRDQRPWNITEWWGEPSPEDRKKRVRGWMKKMLKEADIMIMVKTAKEKYAAYKKTISTQASSLDRIPPSFRPTSLTKSPPFDASNIPFTDAFMESVETHPISEIEGAITHRAFQLAVAGILNAHEAANATGMINPASPRSESSCCYLPIQEVRKGKIAAFLPDMAQQESMAISIAETILRKRDPTHQSNGSHLWVRWTPPEPTVSVPVAPDASYFKLFMRTCFKGTRAGDIHEFGRRLNGKALVFQCRNCGFQAPRDPLIIMSDLNEEDLHNANPKRKGPLQTKIYEEASSVLAAAGVKVDASTFEGLLNIVCRKQKVDPYVLPDKADSSAIFSELSRLIIDDSPLMPNRLRDWDVVTSTIDIISKLGNQIEEDRRTIIWAEFSTKYDELKARLIEVVDSREGFRAAQKPKFGIELVETIERLTEEPLFKGPSEINKNWVVGLERLGTQFSQMVFGQGTWFGFPYNVKQLRKIKNSLFSGLKWFGSSIKEKHTQKFENMIESILGSTNAATVALNKAELQSDSAIVLKTLGSYVGKIISYWSTNIKSLHFYGLTNTELSNMLRWIVFSSMETLFVTSSPLYTPVSSESNKLQMKLILLVWVKESFEESRKQFDMFGISDIEVEAAILDLREKEKISIIKEIDDIKDPDEKASMMMMKKLGLGRWAVGTKKGGEFDAQYWDFLQAQRDRIGVLDTYGVARPGKENPTGFDFAEAPQAERGYETYAGEHDDAWGGE